MIVDKDNSKGNGLIKLFLIFSIINLGFNIYIKSKMVEKKKNGCNCTKN